MLTPHEYRAAKLHLWLWNAVLGTFLAATGYHLYLLVLRATAWIASSYAAVAR